jgi:hypothetical protein
LDIFGPTGTDGLGETPVVAVADGYLTRLPEWRSAVILRIPEDPLRPGRQIWVYYAHMADADGRSYIVQAFPPGTTDDFVTAGTLLGYQGNYSADPDNPTGMHLHFSIVEADGQGRFRSELQIENTLDPGPYLGLEVNASRAGDEPVTCPAVPASARKSYSSPSPPPGLTSGIPKSMMTRDEPDVTSTHVPPISCVPRWMVRCIMILWGKLAWVSPPFGQPQCSAWSFRADAFQYTDYGGRAWT